MATLASPSPAPRPRRSAATGWLPRLLLGWLCALALACGGSGGGSAPQPGPVITAVSPASGAVASLVTIRGTGLTGPLTVRFGGVTADEVQIANGGVLLTVKVPAGASTGSISVATANGSHTFATPFTVLAAPPPPAPPLPVITGFTPAAAPPGAEVTITGTGLTGTSAVAFNGVAAALPIWQDSATQIRVTVPAGASSGRISVVTPGGIAGSTHLFAVTAPDPAPAAAPTLTGFTPAQGPEGTEVTVTGSHFSGQLRVDFNGLAAQRVRVVDPATLAALVPAGATSGPITVANEAGSAVSATSFTVTPAPPAPGVTAIAPVSGPVGTVVTLTGTGFAGATQVLFNGVPDPSFTAAASDTQLSATVPAGATTGPITVMVPGRRLDSASFTVTGTPGPVPGGPTVSALSITSGRAGARVTFTGTGLAAATQVFFGAVAASNIDPQGDTVLVAEVPAAAAAGPVAVTVAAPAGSTAPVNFTVEAAPPRPTLTGYPASAAAGDLVTLTGSGFDASLRVDFGGQRATQVTVVSATQATVTVPATAAAGPIRVFTDGGHADSASPFTPAAELPTAVTGMRPQAGPAGSPVVLTGTRLDQVQRITFGPVDAPAFTRDSATQITVTAPAGGSGAVVLHTAPGDAPVPGPGFTETPGAPFIIAFNPAQGAPGTEVTLTGIGLDQVIEVTYAGAPLAGGRYDLLSDTRMRVRIPDAAAASGPIAVRTAAGASATDVDFTLLPSRTASFNRTFTPVANTLTGETQLDFPARRRTLQYSSGGMNFPQAPIFHAYNPAPGPGGRLGNTTFSLNLKLEGGYYDRLPDPIKARITQLGIPRDAVDIFVVSQNYAYTGVGVGTYELRPHYWTDPQAPDQGNYDTGTALGCQLFGQEPARGIQFRGRAPDFYLEQGITVHPQRDALGIVRIVSSNDSHQMDGFNALASTTFWTLVTRTADPGRRTAVTLHILLSDADQALLSVLTPGLQDIVDLLDGIRATPALAGIYGMDRFRALFAPAAAVTSRVPFDQVEGMDLLTLQGDGLSRLRSIRLGGRDLDLVVQSDAVLRVLYPADGAGDLTLVTDMGTVTVPVPAAAAP